ncbi:hypothetical protein IMY05_C4592000100 [Salix suchowensis]|nr:hypothetical protein IMY05_C4592000100 [Salix suchowensis]
MNPFYEKYGFSRFLDGFNLAEVYSLIHGDRYRTVLSKLYEERMRKPTEELETWNPEIRHPLYAQAFRASNATTHATYLLQGGSVHAGLNATPSQAPLIGTKQAFYMFNEEQEKSLSSLRDSIDRGDKKWCCPLCAFLAGTLVDSKSTWRKIALFPPIIAKVQFMLRLLAVRKFRVEFNKAILANSTKKEEPEALILLFLTLTREMRAFAIKYLRDDSMSPFSMMRNFMREASRIVFKDPSETPPIVWRLPDGTFGVERHVFSLDDIKEALNKGLNDLDSIIQNDVLLGIDLDGVGLAYDPELLVDSMDIRTPRHCVFGAHNNKESQELARILINQHDWLGTTTGHTGGDLVDMDPVASAKWLRSLHKAWRLFLALQHLLKGPPGRATEEVSWNFANTSTSRRHLFVYNHPVRAVQELFGAYMDGRKLNVRLCRHLILLIQRRVLPHTFREVYEDAAYPEVHAAAEETSGHGVIAGMYNYGRTELEYGGFFRNQQLKVEVCLLLHKLWGVESFSDVPLSKFAKSREQLDGEHPAQAAFRRKGLVFKKQEARDPEVGVPPSDRRLRSATGGEGRGRVGVPRAEESEPAVSESGRQRSASRGEGSKKALGHRSRKQWLRQVTNEFERTRAAEVVLGLKPQSP